MDTPKNEKRKKPVFAPMKIKVQKAPEEEVPAAPGVLDTDRLKAVPQAFDGSTIANPKGETPSAKIDSGIQKNIQQIPTEVPANIPTEVPANIPTEVPVEVPVEVPAEVPAETPKIKSSPERKALVRYKDQESSEIERDPYKIQVPPPAWVPPTRRGFTKFFDSTFAADGEYAAQFTLQPKLLGQKDWDACKKLGKADQLETFLYQQFIREYLRSDTPYRGLLVYHGLGSGKTCSAIGAAEALFGQGHKKIIIMTPGSIRENFQSEIQKCGFRHYSLSRNHWISINVNRTVPGVSASTLKNFALNIIGLSETYFNNLMRKPSRGNLWIPDFDQQPNYNDLDSTSQTEIRQQITAVLENRIEFINYNGVSETTLREWLCHDGEHSDEPGHFDNAIIVIDEIHHLSQSMNNNLHRWMEHIMTKRGPAKRLVPPEPVTPDRWKPKLCSLNKKYSRPFLLYRLISEARNSKVIGLSGTPLINFPSELGPLLNMIGGYTHAIKFTIADRTDGARNTMKELGQKHSRIDFIEVTPGQTDVQILMTVFPDGYLKVVDGSGEFMGVREADADEVTGSVRQIAEELTEQAKVAGITFKRDFELVSYPILPVNPKEFDHHFVNANTNKPEHIGVMKKRIYGLVSYYKGSNEDLVPAIKEDIIVPIRFSQYALQYYTVRRLKELTEKSKDLLGKQNDPDPYDEYSKVQSATNPSAYRTNSRQACNFAFPPGIRRPYKSIKTEEAFASETEDKTISLVSDYEYDITDKELAEEAAAAAEDLAVEKEMVGLEEEEQTGGGKAEEDAAVRDFLKKAKEEAKLAGFDMEEFEDELTTEPLKQIDPYDVRLNKALNELYVKKKQYLRLDGPSDSNLQKYSPKFAEMIRNIINPERIPGSSLVYSNFITAEGLTIFGYALESNGFTKIEITGTESDPMLTPEAEASLRKGPGARENRFAFFTGEDWQRKTALRIFNGRINELPPKIQKIMRESGYEELGNKHGEICKVFGITKAGVEGISLKFVRGVHIMEPHWNEVQTDQAKGRAVRICSHAELPPEDRTVSIFTYVMEFTKEDIDEKRVIEAIKMKDKEKTTDQHILMLAKKKSELTGAFLKIMKEAAIDCPLFAGQNEPGLKCYQALDGSPTESAAQPNLETNVHAGEIEERLQSRHSVPGRRPGEERIAVKAEAKEEAPAAAAQPGIGRQVIELKGQKLFLEPDPEAGDPTVYLAYDILDLKKKTPIYRLFKDPVTGTWDRNRRPQRLV